MAAGPIIKLNYEHAYVRLCASSSVMDHDSRWPNVWHFLCISKLEFWIWSWFWIFFCFFWLCICFRFCFWFSRFLQKNQNCKENRFAKPINELSIILFASFGRNRCLKPEQAMPKKNEEGSKNPIRQELNIQIAKRFFLCLFSSSSSSFFLKHVNFFSYNKFTFKQTYKSLSRYSQHSRDTVNHSKPLNSFTYLTKSKRFKDFRIYRFMQTSCE